MRGVRIASLVAQMVQSLPAVWETRVQFLGQEIPWRRTWQTTPVILPGKSHGRRSLAVYSPWGPKESDTTEATSLSLSRMNDRNEQRPFKKNWTAEHTECPGVQEEPCKDALNVSRLQLSQTCCQPAVGPWLGHFHCQLEHTTRQLWLSALFGDLLELYTRNLALPL